MKIWATGVAGWTLSRAVGSVPVAARSTFACRLAMAGPEGRRNCAAHRLRIYRASPAASLHVERPNARIASRRNRVVGFFRADDQVEPLPLASGVVVVIAELRKAAAGAVGQGCGVVRGRLSAVKAGQPRGGLTR
jgi:hypothetical protein